MWSQALLPNRIVSETRHPLRSEPDEEGGVLAAPAITRRTMLIRLMAAAFAGLGAALAIPVFSLGPAPGRELGLRRRMVARCCGVRCAADWVGWVGRDGRRCSVTGGG